MGTVNKSTAIRDAFIARARREAELFALARGSASVVRLAVSQCMDGRVNIRAALGVPFGAESLRGVGGRIDLGNEAFRADFERWLSAGDSRAPAATLVTYHFSESGKRLGCKGFGYDTSAAHEYAEGIEAALRAAYGSVLYPLRAAFETDTRALVFHGRGGMTLDTRKGAESGVGEIGERLSELYPDMPDSLVEGLSALVQNNIRYAADTARRAPEDRVHREQAILIGFDFLNAVNIALTLDHRARDLAESVAVAGGILLENLEEDRIPADEGVAIVVAVPYSVREPGARGFSREEALRQARALAEGVDASLRSAVPALAEHLAEPIVGVFNRDEWRFEPLE